MKCSIVKGVPFACCFGVAGRMAHLTTCEEVAELIAAYCTCNESGNTCEHGHLARKCEVCELKEAVKVLSAEVVGNAKDRAVGKHWDAEINDAVWENPIAAAAVREASK